MLGPSAQLLAVPCGLRCILDMLVQQVAVPCGLRCILDMLVDQRSLSSMRRDLLPFLAAHQHHLVLPARPMEVSGAQGPGMQNTIHLQDYEPRSWI